MDIDFSVFASLKGEFESEGLNRTDVAAEAIFAARHGLEYLVKISGAEAKSDVFYLVDIGVTSLVCPMVETPFAMQKYMEMLPPGTFEHIGVTIETITAVANIKSILEYGKALSEVTIGRTDLTSSYNGDSVESDQTVAMVKTVAQASKARNLKVTIGGSVSKHTRELLKEDAELRSLIDYVETRKAVIPVERFLDEASLTYALKVEEVLLLRRSRESQRTMSAVSARLAALSKRI
jgi:4-hydroxy-2-oxoheptanedioate aldolase